jgi:tRNA (guanine26-N2/guanine27-N2)-dimethyltransferase
MEIPVGFTSITEGKATILFPTDNGVFYNPVQQFNRDLSIAAIRCWAEGKREKLKRQNAKFKLCEALSASGLRSIRYAKELVDYLQSIIANDMSADAVESIRRNCEFNNVAPELVVPNKADAW